MPFVASNMRLTRVSTPTTATQSTNTGAHQHILASVSQLLHFLVLMVSPGLSACRNLGKRNTHTDPQLPTRLGAASIYTQLGEHPNCKGNRDISYLPEWVTFSGLGLFRNVCDNSLTEAGSMCCRTLLYDFLIAGGGSGSFQAVTEAKCWHMYSCTVQAAR